MSFNIIGNSTLPYFQINDITNNIINSYAKNIFTLLIFGETFKVVNYTNYETVLTFQYLDIASPYFTSAALLYQYLIDNQYFILVNIVIQQDEILQTINVNLTQADILNVRVIEQPISITGFPVLQNVSIVSAVELEIKNDSGNPIPISATALPLPVGASTSALQTSGNASLVSIDAGIPSSLGQATMANSMPITIASNQTAIPITISTDTRTYGSKNMGLTPISMPSAVTNYLAVGIRLKVANIANIANIISLSATVFTNDQFLWSIIETPTYSIAPTWVSFGASSYIETTVTAAITLTGGVTISSGYSYQSAATSITTGFICFADIQLKAPSGTPTEYILAISPLTSNALTLASINWFQI